MFVSLLEPSAASAEYGLDACARLSTAAARRARSKCIEAVGAADRPAAERRIRPVGNVAGDAHRRRSSRVRKLGTIGLPLPDTDMKIVDVETGTREMPIGEDGELCIAGPAGDEGILEQARRDARTCCGRTPTAACGFTPATSRAMDADGYTSIVQRKKDMIIVDGFNVYPSEVEAVLYAHPAVRLAAVIGVPDAYHGEVVEGVRRAEAGRDADRRRDHRVLPREPRRLQGAAAGRNPRHAADERRRQDSLSRAARRARALAHPVHETHGARLPHLVEARATMSGLEFFRRMLAGEHAAAADDRPARHPHGRRSTKGASSSPRRSSEHVLQRHRRRARRLRGDAARLRARLRDQLGDAGRHGASPRSS